MPGSPCNAFVIIYNYFQRSKKFTIICKKVFEKITIFRQEVRKKMFFFLNCTCFCPENPQFSYSLNTIYLFIFLFWDALEKCKKIMKNIFESLKISIHIAHILVWDLILFFSFRHILAKVNMLRLSKYFIYYSI